MSAQKVAAMQGLAAACCNLHQQASHLPNQTGRPKSTSHNIPCTTQPSLRSPYPHTASSRPATASGGAKKKGHGGPQRALAAQAAANGPPSRGAQKGLRSALCWHPRRALQTAMQPPHPTLPGTMQHAVQVQCSAAAGRCSRAGWRPRRRGRQAGHRAARFSYPFSRQRDASSQPAALRQPCRSALASLRHLQEGVEDERCVQAGGTFRRQHGGGGGAGVAPTALIPEAPSPASFHRHSLRAASPACLPPLQAPSAPLVLAPPRQPSLLENNVVSLQALGGTFVTARRTEKRRARTPFASSHWPRSGGSRACSGLQAGRRSGAHRQRRAQTGLAAAAQRSAESAARAARWHSTSPLVHSRQD